MPYYRRYRKRTYKRPYRRRQGGASRPYRRRGRKYTSVRKFVKQGTLIADKQFVKFKYNSTFTFSTGSVGTYVYAGNSLYDPNITGAGGQPQGFDQWQGFYTRYRVRGCKIVVTFVEGGASAGNMRQYVVTPCTEDQVTTLTAMNPLVQSMQPRAKTTYSNVNVGAGAITRISHYAKTKDIFGVTSDAVTDDEYSSLVSANPYNLWCWVIANRAIDSTSSPNVYVQVALTYYAELFDRRQVGAS